MYGICFCARPPSKLLLFLLSAVKLAFSFCKEKTYSTTPMIYRTGKKVHFLYNQTKKYTSNKKTVIRSTAPTIDHRIGDVRCVYGRSICNLICVKSEYASIIHYYMHFGRSCIRYDFFGRLQTHTRPSNVLNIMFNNTQVSSTPNRCLVVASRITFPYVLPILYAQTLFFFFIKDANYYVLFERKKRLNLFFCQFRDAILFSDKTTEHNP